MRANILTILILLIVSFLLATFLGCSDKSEASEALNTEEVYALAKAEALKTTGPGQPALWKLSDADSDVYILGTVHVLRPETGWETETIVSAFNDSQRFYMEADIMSSDAQQTMLRLTREKGELPAGENLFDYMDVGDAYNLKRALNSIGFDPEALENLQPWFASMQVGQYQIFKSGYNPLSGVEIVLNGRAKQQNKSLHFFETLEYQMDVLSGGEFEDQLDALVAMKDVLDEGAKSLDLIVEEWADGDVAGLGAVVANAEIMGSEDFYDRLLTQRNRNWIPQIIDILEEPGSSFVAVGAAHLAGEDSVILMLQEEGFTAERIQ